MRHAIAVVFLILPFWANDGFGESTSQVAAPPPASLSAAAPLPWSDAGADAYGVVVIAAGATLAVIAANFVTGGMLTPFIAIGTATPAAPAAAAATTAAGVGSAGASPLGASVAAVVALDAALPGLGMEILVVAAAPAAALQVAAPVHYALRDGYTTPKTLLLAIGESANRTKDVVVEASNYIGSAVSSWWSG